MEAKERARETPAAQFFGMMDRECENEAIRGYWFKVDWAKKSLASTIACKFWWHGQMDYANAIYEGLLGLTRKREEELATAWKNGERGEKFWKKAVPTPEELELKAMRAMNEAIRNYKRPSRVVEALKGKASGLAILGAAMVDAESEWELDPGKVGRETRKEIFDQWVEMLVESLKVPAYREKEVAEAAGRNVEIWHENCAKLFRGRLKPGYELFALWYSTGRAENWEELWQNKGEVDDSVRGAYVPV